MRPSPWPSSSSRRRQRRRLPAAPEHVLQLFDTDESLSHSVSEFLHAGAAAGQSLLVLATPMHWAAISSELRSRGTEPDALATRGRLTVLDAEATLGQFMRQGRPNRALFEQAVAPLVGRLARAAPKGLRVYGEMVELLACEGNYTAAAELEQLWNQLASRQPFALLCGYSAAHFAAPDAGSALREICREHAYSLSGRADVLGRFLLGTKEHAAALESAREP